MGDTYSHNEFSRPAVSLKNLPHSQPLSNVSVGSADLMFNEMSSVRRAVFQEVMSCVIRLELDYRATSTLHVLTLLIDL